MIRVLIINFVKKMLFWIWGLFYNVKQFFEVIKISLGNVFNYMIKI